MPTLCSLPLPLFPTQHNTSLPHHQRPECARSRGCLAGKLTEPSGQEPLSSRTSHTSWQPFDSCRGRAQLLGYPSLAGWPCQELSSQSAEQSPAGLGGGSSCRGECCLPTAAACPLPWPGSALTLAPARREQGHGLGTSSIRDLCSWKAFERCLLFLAGGRSMAGLLTQQSHPGVHQDPDEGSPHLLSLIHHGTPQPASWTRGWGGQGQL